MSPYLVTYNVLEPDITRAQVSDVIQEFQTGVVARVREGYTGREPGHQIWTFSSSLMFSLAIFTTIGQYQQVLVKYIFSRLQVHHFRVTTVTLELELNIIKS